MQRSVAATAGDFAVIVPTYNRADTIEQALSSVIEQTVAPSEIIVVDDGSTDDTVRRVMGIGSPLIRILVNDHNLGATASRNRGAKVATAEWVAFLDSDDYWHPQKLETERALIAATGDGVSAIASNHVLVIDGQVRNLPTQKERVGDVARALHSENFLGTCSCMTVRRKQFLAIGGFNEQLKSCQDWDLWIRAADAGEVLISKPAHVFYRLNTRECISTDGRRRQSGHIHVWKSHIRREGLADGDRVRLALIFADVCYNRGKQRSFSKLCRYALAAEPRRFRQIGLMLWHGATAPDYLTYRRRVEQSLELMQRVRHGLFPRRSAA
jgi:glycosyltransferase involved in cell wall biosynthesis